VVWDEQQWQRQRTSFGATAASYDSYRPDWPAATAAWLIGAEDGDPTSRQVLDLGAGTGKLTRTLVSGGHRVTAVDPSEGMLAVLAQALPQVHTVLASAERLPLPAASFDAVTVAQAWHWLDQESAAAECARVLRPGGVLGIGWHLRSASESWVAELDALVGQPEYQGRRAVRSRVASIDVPPPFADVQKTTFDYRLRLTPEALVALASSWSYLAVRPDRDRVLAEVEALGRRVVDGDGKVTLPYVTHCYRATRGASS
jgi:ubiquinone/menaquinone biosynthesis C-methylase UbiE